jgi:effector-binding domain-containing protein
MLSIMHIGDQDNGHRRSHHALGSWLARHGCHLNGPGREIIHDPDRPGRAPTVEIQYPVDLPSSPRGP